MLVIAINYEGEFSNSFPARDDIDLKPENLLDLIVQKNIGFDSRDDINEILLVKNDNVFRFYRDQFNLEEKTQ